jgi:predicted branched-subunit amino acid permease
MILNFTTNTKRFSYALPSVLVQLGYSAAKAQLMTVPIYAGELPAAGDAAG